MRGGYKLINFLDFAITSVNSGSSPTPTTIPGVYEALESNYGKMTVVHGLNIDTVQFSDFAANISTVESKYTFICEYDPASYFVVQITKEDAVTAVKYSNE